MDAPHVSAGACALCGGRLGRSLLTIRVPDRFERHAGIAEAGYRRDWVECGGCGAATNVATPESRERLRAMAGAYYEVDFAGAGQGGIAEKFRKVMSLSPEKSDNAGRVGRILDHLRSFRGEVFREGESRFRAIDIGAGTGVFLAKFLERLGPAAVRWETVALEPDPSAAAHLRSLGFSSVREELFRGQPDLRGFDLVTLNKIVEHVEDPLALLRDVRGALDPRCGTAYVEVPDRLTIGCRPPGDNILGALHCHLYDPGSLTRLLARAGLAVLSACRVFEPSGKITVFAFATTEGGIERLARAGEGDVR